MEHDIIPLAGILGFFITSAYMVKYFLDYRERMRVLDKSKSGGAASDERFSRVEQAVESIAIEIERVSEGQRFVTKLLNEKAQVMAIECGEAGVGEESRHAALSATGARNASPLDPRVHAGLSCVHVVAGDATRECVDDIRADDRGVGEANGPRGDACRR